MPGAILESVILTINTNCHTSAERHRQAVDTQDHKCTAELINFLGKFSPTGGGSQVANSGRVEGWWDDFQYGNRQGRCYGDSNQREWTGLRIVVAISLIRMISVL